MSKVVARLFEQFQPENYKLHIRPNRNAMTFSGTIEIRGRKVGRPSQRLTFHQKGLKVTAASIVKNDKKSTSEVSVARINNQNSLDEVRLHADELIYPGEYSVTIEFEGKITRTMLGVYPCFFKHDGKDKQLIATQFESHHAREAFPCIDEPEAKATFELTLTTAKDETVLSNTPVKSRKTTGKQTVTVFDKTPRMSVYLLAFVVGELQHYQSKTKSGTIVRSYATPVNAKLTEFSVDVAVKVLEFFEDYFGIPYPLPKLDMVALPDFSSGAMENWGLVTYRESIMLVDPKHSSIESKQQAALVIAHELSHQWFGNLVTMRWWDDLWLNESFANLMEYVAVDALFPEWQIWEQFVSHESAIAKRRDSLADVQPIRTAVNHPDEISTLFDPAIVYAKGGTVLHMLMNYIGQVDFRKGLQAYFKKHAYGNTSADDLWQALSAVSHKNINDFMAGWLDRPGYPLVSVNWKPGAASATLDQKRFLSDPGTKLSSQQSWKVPLASSLELSSPILTKNKSKLEVKVNDETPFLLNKGGKSYLLPRYVDAAHRQEIIHSLKRNEIGSIDRYLLIDNNVMLQKGGLGATTELLELLQAYHAEASETVWSAIAAAISEVRKLVEADEPSEAKLDQLVQELVLPLAESLGWEDAPGDSPQTLRLRGLVVAMAAGSKAESIIKAGLERFKKFQTPIDLSASTRGTIYFCGARYGTDKDFKRLLRLHKTATNADERDELAGGLTGAKQAERYEQLIQLLDSDQVRRQDLLHWFVWLLRNRYSRNSTWQWLVSHWSWIEKEFASDKSYGNFARYSGSIFSHQTELSAYLKFFEPKKKIIALSRDIALGEQEIRSRIAWRDRNESAVKAWLKNL